MQTMSDKEFDNLFREKFRSFEPEPSDAVWSRISEGLEERGGKRSLSRAWLAAASVTVIVAASIWFYKPSETIRLYGSKIERVVSSSMEAQPDLVKPAKKQESVFTKLADLKVRSRKHMNSFKSSTLNKATPVEEPEIAESTSGRSEDIRPAEISSEQLLTVKTPPAPGHLNIPENHKTVLALVSESNVDKEEYQAESERTKPGIKTVGDLVNFVVSKVDKRRDKLIEFSENDEGPQITGINLGVLKIKAKTNSENRN